MMSEADSQRILEWLDCALELFHHNEGQLTAREISILSMLAVARQDLAEHARAGKFMRPGSPG